MLSDLLSRINLQSWGSSVDALNTTYPLPPPDHRVLLTVVFVPLLLLWLQLHNDNLLAPKRLIGIFWVRRRNFMAFLCTVLCSFLLNWRTAITCRARLQSRKTSEFLDVYFFFSLSNVLLGVHAFNLGFGFAMWFLQTNRSLCLMPPCSWYKW